MLRPAVNKSPKEIYLKLIYDLERKYYKVRNNFLALQRNRLINPLEEQTMELEVKRAHREWQNNIL